ncbi:hypothetical protein QFZ34_003980 [Phyllobacterium ifriqiyense]|uniref:DUF885 domain-containing protein n=1 Tax=Phyllobacterium ifriqiyense TaxID=314238 RepID=A0ABU0SGE8_9HYPH|nr:hypothetical protein [Phyllobacterium ifriqiyense]MDQ0998798.1 hypothetical protein [Phyllobacterium ifriqiyense]
MKPPGIVVTSVLLTVGYAGFFATRPAPPLAPVIERYQMPDRAVALNEEIVTRFLYGYAPVAAAQRELDEDDEASVRTAILDAKAREFGFASYADWLDTNNTIMVTYHWATHPQPQQEVEKAIASVPTMVALSPEQKAEAINGLKSGLAQIQNARPSLENIVIVERHLRSLKPFYNQWVRQQ